MIKQPLFGQDSSPHQTSMFLSGIITLIAWIIFCVLSLVVKFKPKTPQYKEVQIVLSSTPVVEKEKSSAEEAAAAVEESMPSEPEEIPEIPKPVETPVAAAKVEAPKETPAPAKAQNKTPPKVEKTYRKVEEPETYGTFLGDDIDFGTKKSTTDVDWDSINYRESESSQPNNINRTVQGASGYKGVEGISAGGSDIGKKSSSQQNVPSDNSPSEETMNRLNAIRKSYKKSTGNIDSIVTAETTTSNGYVNMKMSDGTTRSLLDPMTPVIELSPAAAVLIDSSRVVNIKIRVVESGNVPRAEITITPESIIPEAVRREIYDQLSKWRFEAAPMSSTATFEYTIKKQ